MTWLIILLIVAALPSFAEEKSLQWTPSEIMKIKWISDVQLSPDNHSVLFVSTEAGLDQGKNSYLSRIYRADAAGITEPILFTSPDYSSANPRWSPDGKWIGFLSNRTGKINLYVISSQGGEAIELLEKQEDVQLFRWSPNSQQIAFVMADDIESEKSQKSKTDTLIYKKQKSVNRLWLIDLLSPKAPQILTSDAYHVRGYGDFSCMNEEFDWSPDGKTIAFAYSPGPGFDHYHLDSHIATIDIATRQTAHWENTGSFEALPRYSPDGRWIAYVCMEEQPHYAYRHRISVRDAEGKNFRTLAKTFNEGSCLARPSLLGWISDESIAFFEPKGTKFHLVRLPLDGTAACELQTSDCYFRQPALSQDRTMLSFVSESPTHPQEAHVTLLEPFIPVQISHLNQRFLSFPSFKSQVVHWTSVDGLPIEGLLTYPHNYKEGQRYPLAVVLHGGPMGFFSEKFIGNPYPYPCASFAESGFFVLKPNPRGSTGYGSAFRSANREDWGGKDYLDIMTGVDFLISEGKVDPDRMGIMGWSYGGYLTAWTITQTSRFKAASLGAAMTNLTSFIGTTDLHTLLLNYLGNFSENLLLYLERSPLSHVQNVMTPCLIQHGLGDKRVPVSQAYEFYHALDREGKAPFLLLYPDSGHYFEKPRVELEAIEANLNWFLKHLNPSHSHRLEQDQDLSHY